MANQFARELRRNVTDAEKKLWQQLRLLKNEHRHFRCQVPIGKYIADFACHRCRLVVELDGGQHSEPANLARDQARTEELQRLGYRVVRFWNAEVFENLEGVIDMIRHKANLPTTYDFTGGTTGATSTPDPIGRSAALEGSPPQGRGGIDG